jgi:hypothetical protein
MNLKAFYIEQDKIADWIISAFVIFVLLGIIVIAIFLISRKQIMSDVVQLKK